jgi:hypothetical protein
MLNLFFAIFDAVLPFRENRIVNKLYTIKLNFWHLPKKNVKTNIKIGKILVYKIGLKFRYISAEEGRDSACPFKPADKEKGIATNPQQTTNRKTK